jgi:predicted small metal-binding protein
MDYSAVSQVAKRFEQEIKVNHKIGEIRQKMITILRERVRKNFEI